MSDPEPDPTPAEIELAKKSLAIYQRRDPVRFTVPNFFQQRLFYAVREPKPESLTVVLALKPNRVGGSFGLMNILSAIIYGSENPMFQGYPFGKDWPFLKSFRLFSTAENLGDVGALQLAMRAVFPVGKYTQGRGVGKAYNSALTTTGEWTGDMFSYGQDALAVAGANKGLILMSEPPPRPVFTEAITRLSGNGMLIVECVQMDLAPWLEEMADESAGRAMRLRLHRLIAGTQQYEAVDDPLPDALRYGTLKLDGKAVGEIRVVRGDVEDACREHSNGHMAHSAIEAMVAAWPAEEREARRRGTPMKLSGRIYPNWGEENELHEIPAWHQEQWDAGNVRVFHVNDPHDQKPYAVAWFAVYPNDDVICFQEWPPFDFAACKNSPVTELEEYRAILLGLDDAVGREVDGHLMDKLFGNTPGKGTSRTLRKMFARPCRQCLRHVGRLEYEDLDERSQAYLDAERNCPHRIVYTEGVTFPGSVSEGHTLVRDLLGLPGKTRPKIMALAPFTPNFCRGMRRYAWKENSSEEPELRDKDFPDLIRNLVLKGWHVYPREITPPPTPPRTWRVTATPPPIPTQSPMTRRDARPRMK